MPQESQTAAPNEPPGVFDEQALLERLLDDRQLAGRIIQAFLASCPGQLEGLRHCLSDADAGAACAQAHTLKGAAANIAASRLSAIGLQMEAAGKAGRLDRLAELLPSAEQEFQRLKQAIASGWLGKEQSEL